MADPAGHSVMTWIQVRDAHAGHTRLAAAAVPVIREPATERRYTTASAGPNRSGIEKRQGAAGPSVASDGRHHAEP